MLSYQHAYHAGNLADIHKHEWMCRILSTMIKKDKPLTYFETHSGRGLYDLQSTEALKTGEAAKGIIAKKPDDLNTTYRHILDDIKRQYGDDAYPGSPFIAKTILRDMDKMHLAELHPKEYAALNETMKGDKRIQTHHQDGFDMVSALCPPNPRRGMLLIDPSYEIKTEYNDIPKHIAKLHKIWNVGVIALWYPILPSNAHKAMIETMAKAEYPKFHVDEVMFDSGLDNHRLKGSGMAFINMPWMDDMA